MAKKVTQASKGLGTNSVGLATELSLVSKLLQKVIPKKIFAHGRGAGEDRNTSGQRGNNFNTSYRDISVVVAENNSVCKAKMLTVYFAK